MGCLLFTFLALSFCVAERTVHPTMAYSTLCEEQNYCVNGVCYIATQLQHPVPYCV